MHTDVYLIFRRHHSYACLTTHADKSVIRIQNEVSNASIARISILSRCLQLKAPANLAL